jgi:transcriptional regulator with XRE-family HTH domain
MKAHNGKIVEYTIRKKGVSITELARLINVNRRSVYNWFNQEELKVEIIYQIGIGLKHDFSREFPELFAKDEFHPTKSTKNCSDDDKENKDTKFDAFWKERYITLLEDYNSFLIGFNRDN